jgi:hypothetical protein
MRVFVTQRNVHICEVLVLYIQPIQLKGISRMEAQKYRLVTRSDFDGLVCGMLLRELDLIDDIKFVHPKDMQDGIGTS